MGMFRELIITIGIHPPHQSHDPPHQSDGRGGDPTSPPPDDPSGDSSGKPAGAPNGDSCGDQGGQISASILTDLTIHFSFGHNSTHIKEVETQVSKGLEIYILSIEVQQQRL